MDRALQGLRDPVPAGRVPGPRRRASLFEDTRYADLLAMIVRPRPTLIQLFFVLRGSVVPRIAPQILLYTLLLHRTAHLFCFLPPFGRASTLGRATPSATALVTYTFSSLGDELEEPFGTLPNDLPIGALADTIEINLRDALGETDLPPLPVPRDFRLM